MTRYDYVVVGAGSAGCVLANRLSAGNDVLLLEAGGPDEKREISIPIAHVDLLGTEVDWDFQTTPQDALGGRRVTLPQGRTLGGSSSINAQMYFRGHAADFAGWAAATDDGWGPDSVAAYYGRLEDAESGPLGSGGPQHLDPVTDPHPVTSALVEAAAATGLNRAESVARDAEGVGYCDVIQKGGERYSAADAYLKPVLDRDSLTAETGAEVRRLRFDGARATGVLYVQDGVTREATASEEVIVAAGAINSPRLLLLSGLGPAAHLREHGIDVRADLPVGENLQDHALVYTNYRATTDTYDDAESLWNVAKYLLLKRGPLTSNGTEAVGYWRSREGLDAPDIQFMLIPATIEGGDLAEYSWSGFTVGVGLVAPESRGRVRLRSDDPDDDPVIDPGYLTADEDVEALVRGVEKAQEIAAAEPLAEVYDGRNFPETTDEDGIREHVRQHAGSYYHLAGTCRMGVDPDDGAVVDAECRVHGVEGLRVVDASVLPTIPRVNTYGPTMMVAERAADLILEAA
ncbi:MAG: GMC family oxidoreductase [Haloglomus sp.]